MLKLTVCIGILFYSSLAQAQGEFEIWDGSGIENEFSDHKTCEQHAFSRALYNFQLWNEYSAQNELLNMCLDANPELDPTCQPIQRNELFKPVSESHGTPALLLASSLHGQALSIEDAQGNQVGSVLRTSCCNNNGRAHWFFRERCETLPSPLYLRLPSGTCRVVEDPCKRIGG